MSGSQEIVKVSVIGAGTMGAAITQHFLMKGVPVVLLDLQESNLEKGKSSINTSMEEAVEKKIVTPEKKDAILGKLTCTTQYSDIADVDFVVEAVFENFKVKQAVFKETEKHVSGTCIIASNTSSFSITELGSVLERQDRFLGVHYFYHAAKNKLIELIPGANSSQEKVTQLENFYFAKDKAPIIIKDVQGFAVNRFFVPWLNEAARLLEEGLGSISFIDKVAVETFQVGMGPFALMNATGVPIAVHAAQTLADQFGPMYAPCEVLKKQMELGKDWNTDSTETKKNDENAVRNRLVAMSLGVAAQLVSEGVTDETNTDLGARLGLRWPLGPFELMNSLGIEKMRDVVASEFDKWRQPLPTLFSTVDLKKGFEVRHVKTHKMNDVGLIEFNRPDAMNALNELVVNQLAACFDQLDQDADIKKIILFGRGKAFVAGADIKFFVDNISKNDIERIYSFTDFGQKVLRKIENSKKTTIAYLHGLALGGGLELAMACDYRVSTKRTLIAFPETGIGIYPGLGGTQRPTRRIGKGLTKFLIATGTMINAAKAKAYGLVDDEVEMMVGLKEIAGITVDAPFKSGETFAEEAFADFNGVLTAAQKEMKVFQAEAKGLSRKAPLALKKAMELIDEGAELDLEEALRLEMKNLKWIFGTKDAKEGLEGIIFKKRVTFEGK